MMSACTFRNGRSAGAAGWRWGEDLKFEMRQIGHGRQDGRNEDQTVRFHLGGLNPGDVNPIFPLKRRFACCSGPPGLEDLAGLQ